MKPNLFIIGILGAFGVALGALGAHALKDLLEPNQLASFKTGVLYHIIHTFLLAFIFILHNLKPSKKLSIGFNLTFWGIVLFSGSIYLLSLRNVLGFEFLKILGPVTPIGGLLFITSWLLLAFQHKTFISFKNE